MNKKNTHYFLNILIYIIKFIIYFDHDDIDKLNLSEYFQMGGRTPSPGSDKTQPPTSQNNNKFTDADYGLDNDNTIVEGIDTSKDNSSIHYYIWITINTIKEVANMVQLKLGKLSLVFICVATLPALPFFLTMGLMYSVVKYGMFKFREL